MDKELRTIVRYSGDGLLSDHSVAVAAAQYRTPAAFRKITIIPVYAIAVYDYVYTHAHTNIRVCECVCIYIYVCTHTRTRV